ncbi:KPN_02809 family neutral zinc metallopeptidase [Sphingomicrobium astaxanthinifaciens]|uniref:KPN_02809 family neutral zinc metallopeptidase n=1 Tax=Sphingomicrobium astaxanthinifaciens TaxID=1227949 RepID=UPI001FCCB4B8|nr:neutral zinc metallopeptidase [Sphingomicrobium astaxanthinifaciens]MCJ7420723.1 neutral zinc metallopeptidase [Sphingomicrobium astaxanthinifaciens]
MRIGDRDSDNFIDRTGQRGGGMRGGGMSAGLFALLARFVFNKFGIVGVLVLALGYCALSGGLGGLGGGGTPQGASSSGQSTLTQEELALLRGTLESTDDVWTSLFAQAGATYREPELVAYEGGTQTACGFGQEVMGPFYCPGDQRIYIDPDFFSELSQRFGAPGDFAARYVIAHEVGHHIQNLEGTLSSVQRQQQRASRAQGNRLQVGVELQADCYAGVWAARTGAMEPGDLEEGLRAAEAIGDDALMRQAGQAVRPESFTHGTSAQRMEALRRGLSDGNPADCDYAR